MVSPVFVELKASIGEFQAKMGEARAEMAKVSKEGGGHFSQLAAVGKGAFLGLASGAAVVGAMSLKMAGDFQQSTSVLQTAAGETTAGLKTVRKGILDIASSTGTTWQNLTDGMYQVEKAGYRGADGLKVLKAAAQGAREENASLETVTNAMTSVMASYHLKATDSVRVMNALKTAAGEGKMTMEQMAGALSTVLPIASANHISLGQVAGAMATLTQHGTSANEATQELAATIRSLAAPNKVAVAEMQQLGLNSQDVSMNLGKRGLTGTIALLTQTVAEHTKGGLVALGMFKQSASATADLHLMMQQMSPAARQMASDLLNNTVSLKEYRKGVADLDPHQAAMARQFANLSVKATGFSDAIKRGDPASQTMADALKRMTGGAIGLNTVLQLSGESAAGFKDRVDKVSASFNDASSNVEGWDQTQKLFNVQVDELKQKVERAFITIGTKLIPVVMSAAEWMGKHKDIVAALAIGIGVGLVAAITAFGVSLALAMGPVELIILAIAAVAAGVVYAYEHFRTFRVVTWEVIQAVLIIFKNLADYWMGTVEIVLKGSVMMFGWVPGVGGKLKSALKAFESFKTGVDGTLDRLANSAGRKATEVGLRTGKELVNSANKGIKSGAMSMSEAAASVIANAGDTQEAWKRGQKLAADFIAGANAGIRSGALSVSEAAASVIAATDAAARKASDSHSPSRQWERHGKDLVAGLVQGMHKHKQAAIDKAKQIADEISAVMARTGVSRSEAASHVAGGTSPVDRAVAAIQAAHEKAVDAIEAAHKKLADKIAAAHQKAAKAAQDAMIAAAKVIAETMVKTAEDAASAQQKAIDSMTSDLQALKAERDSFMKGIAGDIQGSTTLVDAWKAQGKDGADATVQGLQSSLNQQLAASSQFAANLKQLVADGASQALITQLAQGGTTAGLAMSNALLAAGPDAVASIDAVMAQIKDTGLTAANDIANAYYQPGVDSMTNLIAGMQSREDALQAEVDRVKAIMAQLDSANAAVAAATASVVMSGAAAAPATSTPSSVPQPVSGEAGWTARERDYADSHGIGGGVSGADIDKLIASVDAMHTTLKQQPAEQQRLARTA